MNGQCLGLAHVGVMTNDLEASIAFYEKLGGVVRDRGVVTLPQGAQKIIDDTQRRAGGQAPAQQCRGTHPNSRRRPPERGCS